MSKRKLPSEVEGHCDLGVRSRTPPKRRWRTAVKNFGPLPECCLYSNAKTDDGRDEGGEEGTFQTIWHFAVGFDWGFLRLRYRSHTLPHRRSLLMTRIHIPAPFAELAKVPDTKENDTKLGSSIQ